MLSITASLFETKIPKFMYRSGPVQNIEMFVPKKPKKTHTKKSINSNIIYASSDVNYAAGFCFDWSDIDGFSYGKYNDGPWTLEIPNKYIKFLDNVCSMYTLNGENFKKINITTPEYYSTCFEKVLNEKKFKNCYDCLNYYKVLYKII